MKAEKKPSFDEQLIALEAIVEKMERGGISLEESMGLYEQGTKLEKTLQKQLEESKQRMTVLVNRDGELSEETFAQEKE